MIEKALVQLSERRPVFHSEADFQHALAWEIQRQLPEASVRLEVPVLGLRGRGELDILVRIGERTTAVEVKYFKAALRHSIGKEQFSLPATVARDICRYDACKDVSRLETIVGSSQADEGYLIVLSNDRAHWSVGMKEDSIDRAFKLFEGRQLRGTLAWCEKAGEGTVRNRITPIELFGCYELTWQKFSEIPDVRNGLFRVLVVKIAAGPKLPHSALPETREAETPRAIPRRPDRFDALRRHLRAQGQPEIVLSFEDIEELVGELPPSARKHHAWWHHPHATWKLDGFKASPRLAEQIVRFLRVAGLTPHLEE
jgi:hypothetical protein